MKFFPFCFIQFSAFWFAKFESDVNFHRTWPENVNNPEKLFFPDYREYQIRRQGFPSGRLRLDSLRDFGASLCPMLPAIGAIVLPKASLWSGIKLINSSLFAARGNNTLEFISSNWTPEVDCFVNLFLNPSRYNPENGYFHCYWEFSVTVDRNRHQIWTLYFKIHYLEYRE